MAHRHGCHAEQDLFGRSELFGKILDNQVIDFKGILPLLDLGNLSLLLLEFEAKSIDMTTENLVWWRVLEADNHDKLLTFYGHHVNISIK